MDKFDELREKIVPVLLPYGVKRIALFGSVARGEETPESDLDLLVEFEEPRVRGLGLLQWVHLENQLSQRIARRVEMVSTKALKPRLRPYIEPDLVILYEKA
ncbi:MAG TPA: nucleotidyltransferase family protein [Anaerolineae bacterium]|nr:nucleotidyltransferase family protein [Anaerolineae bacterium]